MALGVREVVLAQRVRVEPHVGVTSEHEHGLFGIDRGERLGVPFVAGVVEVGEGVRELHEGLESALSKSFDGIHELR